MRLFANTKRPATGRVWTLRNLENHGDSVLSIEIGNADHVGPAALEEQLRQAPAREVHAALCEARQEALYVHREDVQAADEAREKLHQLQHRLEAERESLRRLNSQIAEAIEALENPADLGDDAAAGERAIQKLERAAGYQLEILAKAEGRLKARVLRAVEARLDQLREEATESWNDLQKNLPDAVGKLVVEALACRSRSMICDSITSEELQRIAANIGG